MATQVGPKIPVFSGAADGDTYTPPMNRGWRMLQALVQPNVIDFINDPPVSPVDGDTYIVGVGTGAWLGHDNDIAYWTTQDLANPAGVWEFYTPQAGWIAYSATSFTHLKFESGTWFSFTNAFQSGGQFDGAGTPIAFEISPAFTNIGFVVMVTYRHPTVNPGILSVEYIDSTHFTVHTSSGTDGSTFDCIAFPV